MTVILAWLVIVAAAWGPPAAPQPDSFSPIAPEAEWPAAPDPETLVASRAEPIAEALSIALDGYDALLKRVVDADGWVDYSELRSEPAALDAFLAALSDASLDGASREARLALLLNAYNAFTLRLIVDAYPIDSIMKIEESKRWKHERWRIAGRTVSLDQLENDWIRPEFREPRIHFALVCAAVSCPPLRREAFRGDRLEEQLADQTRAAHRGPRVAQFDAGRSQLKLTKLYEWYAQDFVAPGRDVIDFAAEYLPELKSALRAGRRPEIEYLEYDWSLNDRARRP